MQQLINKIHHANCFDILAQLPSNSVDLILTDPPYLTTKFDYDLEATKTLDLSKWFAEIIRVAKPTTPILIFSSGKFTYKMVNLGWQYFRYELIWDKVNKITGVLDSNVRPLLNHEFVLYFSKRFVRGSNKDDGTGQLNVRKLDLANKTDASYLTYTNYNLIALVDYVKTNYPLLNEQANKLQEIIMNNQNISLIDANSMVYNNDIFIQNYLQKNN